MVSQRAHPLDVLVVATDRSFIDTVSGALEATQDSVTARPVDSIDAALTHLSRSDVDGVVLSDRLESPADGIERLTHRTDRPVVLLADGDRESIATAVEAGVTDVYPRRAIEAQSELILQRIADDPGQNQRGTSPEQSTGSPGDIDREPYREVFENVSDGLVVHDPSTGEIIDVNERFCEMNGYTRDELVGESIDVVTPPDEEYSYRAARKRIERAREEGPQLFEWCNQRRDGETFPVEVHLAVVHLNMTEHVLASVRDITERKRREREFEQIFNGVQDAIIVMDPETLEILDANEAYLDMVGYEDLESIREQGIEGLSVTEEGYTVDEGEAVHRRVAETGEAEMIEWQAERRDGERRWLEVKVAPARIGGEERHIAIHRDITERKRWERIIEALHDSTDTLQEAETPPAVCEATVSAAEEVLGLSMPACWLPDGDDGRLKPVAAAEAAWTMPGGPGVFEPGSFEHDIYDGEELVVYDPSERWDRTPLERAFLVPLGDHGLLGAAEPDVEAYDDVTLDAARILARHATSALDRVERARELRESERRFRTIAERVDEIIYMANADLTEVEYVNPAYADVYGRPVEELYEDARAFFDPVHPEDRESFEAEVEAMLDDVAGGDPADSYEFSYRIERPDGERRWIEATGYPILDESDAPHRYVAVAEDSTERHRRERTLETFHEATRELTVADSLEAACRQAVRAAEEVLGFPLVSAHLYDEQSGTLEPVAVTDRLLDLEVEPPSFGPGESLAWQVYVEGDATTSTEPAADVYGPGVSGPDIVLPLGTHGVMLVGAPTASFDREDVELAQILAATLEASLNHVADERALARQREQLQREQERAEKLQRLNDIIRDIEQVTIERSARAGIETAVCERLTEVDPHELVWIAEPSVAADELRPRTSDGGMNAYVDALSLEFSTGAGGHPAVAAYLETETQAVANVATEVPSGEWRTTALQHGVQSAVAVPIRYESTLHGVLVVESGTPDAFDEATQEVLTELGRSIGYAIIVTERERALESEATVQLEFDVDDDGLFVLRAARKYGCEVRLERTVRRAGGSFSTFYAAEGTSPETLVELADTAASIQEAQVVSADQDSPGGLIEVRAPTWFGSVFTDHGGVLREATATDDDDGATVTVEVPRGANVRALVEAFREQYPGAELAAQRQREHTVHSLFELQDALRKGLTDRQWEALETAYSAGYFAWPRETSGQEVAELLGVTQPTFNKHLRVAERTAFRMLLDRESPDGEG